MKKSNIILIILTIVVVFSFVFIFLKKEDINKEEYEVENEVVDNEKWNELKEFPMNDSTVKKIVLSYDEISCEEETSCKEIDYLKNNNLSFELSNIKVDFSCSKYNKDEDYCERNKMVLDSKINFEYKNELEYEYTSSVIFKTSDYYIIKQVNTIYGQGVVNIYSNNGKLLKEIKNSVTEIDVFPNEDEDEMQSYKYMLSVNNNRLFLMLSDYLNFENGLDNIVHFGYIDLKNNFEFVDLYQVKGSVTTGI